MTIWGDSDGIHIIVVSAQGSWAVFAAVPGVKADRLARRLRTGTPPLYATVKNDEVRIDVFALVPEDDDAVVEAFGSLFR